MIERLLAADAAFDRGDLDIADRLYGQVADADPRNAIAVVGLAHVAAGRQASGRARELARRALDIDPDEAAARRLLDELERRAAVTAPLAPPATPATPARPAQVRRRPRWRRWLDRFMRPG